jgi:hypothetical protein
MMKKILLALLVISSLAMAESASYGNVKLNNESKLEAVCTKASMLEDVKQRGCCSWHGGVAGCSGSSVVCNDGTYSPSCTCAKPMPKPLG